MTRIWCFFTGVFLMFSALFLAGCQTEKKSPSEEVISSEETDSAKKAATEGEKNLSPKTYKNMKKEAELFWTTGVEPVQYEISWAVEGTTEVYIRELTDSKYQGRCGGSEGNRAAADWLAEQFQIMGLQQLPSLGIWRQSYETTVTSILPGEASLIAPDGTETQLQDAVDEQGIAENVIAYLPGKDHTKAVVLGANFDGAGQCGSLLMPGAYDNASGVATLLQTAKWLAKSSELPCDVIFAAFNTENNSVKGSAALSEYIENQYVQIRMVNLKCLGWKGQPLTVYGANSESDLRKSLAGGLGIQYADWEIGGAEAAFREENVSSVVLLQDACLNNAEVSSVLRSVHDIPENLDFAMLDDIAKKLAAWVIERGDEPLVSYVVYW